MTADPSRGFSARAMLEALDGARVELVVVGGIAAVLHGSPTVTRDLDICPRRTTANLGRLADALVRLDMTLIMAA